LFVLFHCLTRTLRVSVKFPTLSLSLSRYCPPRLAAHTYPGPLLSQAVTLLPLVAARTHVPVCCSGHFPRRQRRSVHFLPCSREPSVALRQCLYKVHGGQHVTARERWRLRQRMRQCLRLQCSSCPDNRVLHSCIVFSLRCPSSITTTHTLLFPMIILAASWLTPSRSLSAS
jgi:hypothetical protein